MQHDERWAALLVEYVDGTLSPARARQVTGHLAVCAACRAGVEATRAGALALRSAPPPPATTDSTADFLAAVERRAARQLAARGASAAQPGPRSALAAALRALGSAEQARPAAWLLLSAPALGFSLAPGGLTLAIAAAGLALGALLDYAMTTEGFHS